MVKTPLQLKCDIVPANLDGMGKIQREAPYTENMLVQDSYDEAWVFDHQKAETLQVEKVTHNLFKTTRATMVSRGKTHMELE